MARVPLDYDPSERDAGARWPKWLQTVERTDAHDTFVKHGVTDYWFPFPKQTLRQLLRDPTAERIFAHRQEEQCEHYLSAWHMDFFERSPLYLGTHNHFTFEDGDDAMKSDRVLGEGACGIVEQVTLPMSPKPLICVRKRMGRPRQLQAQKKLFDAFIGEVKVMRQVHHHHCVQLVGSYTDYDSVAILSLPVADMDLSAFLDAPELSNTQLAFLRKGIGCLCSALNYLHGKHIRHEDLKPQNVLIHGDTLLLTDFGFSLDFSDDSSSTTTGRPSAWTVRYAAPEVLDFEPRNRATDVYSLGCILVEMLSRMYGHRLSTIKTLWKHSGTGHPSFARNHGALDAWYHQLHETVDNRQDLSLLYLAKTMLASDRHLRPSTQQILYKLFEFDQYDRLINGGSYYLGTCCAPQDEIDALRSKGSPLLLHLWLAPYIDEFTFILLDTDLKVLYSKHDFHIHGSPQSRLDSYVEQPGNIGKVCADLIRRYETSRPQEPKTIEPHVDRVDHALLSAQFGSWKHALHAALPRKVRLPSGAWSQLEQLLYVFLMPSYLRSTPSRDGLVFMFSYHATNAWQ